jgi:hypothetical protein
MPLHASKLDRDLNAVDLGEVDVAGAVRLLDGAIGRTALEHRSVEDAVADTAFTLTNVSDARLDISAFSHDRIHIRFEGTELIQPKLFGFLLTRFTYQAMLPSRVDAIETIETFASRNDSEIKRYLENRWGKERIGRKLRGGDS